MLLSGEQSSIPEAEARSLFLAYDSGSRFSKPEKRVLIVDSLADPFVISSRVAFSRRVGLLLSDPAEANRLVRARKVRVKSFELAGGGALDPGRYLEGVQAEVDLREPDFEFTVVRGSVDYLALTSPRMMSQGWSKRRPRKRAFFHPSAMFPKLSRALVNLSRIREGGVLLDPFAGTGSILIEAAIVGANVVAIDRDCRMVYGSLANMERMGQRWLGVVRADAFMLPFTRVDAVATDLPYGRASSTMGLERERVTEQTLQTLGSVLRTGSRAVIMHAKAPEPISPEDFTVEEEHDLYVHKLLTRTISVLRKR